MIGWRGIKILIVATVLALRCQWAAGSEPPTIQQFFKLEQCLPMGSITPGPDATKDTKGAIWFMADCSTDGINNEYKLYRYLLPGGANFGASETSLGTYNIVNNTGTGYINEAGMALGADGNMWIVAEDTKDFSSVILRVNSGGVITGTFPLPVSFPSGLALGPRAYNTSGDTFSYGSLWFVESNFIAGTPAMQLGSVDPQGNVQMHAVDNMPQGTGAFSLVLGPGRDNRGDLWVPYVQTTDTSDYAGIADVPVNGTATLYPLNDFPGSGLHSIAVGPDGALWVMAATTTPSSVLLRIKADGSQTPFPLPPCTFGDVALGPDGQLWFYSGCGDDTPSVVSFSTSTGKYNKLTNIPNLPSCPANWACGFEGVAPNSITADGKGSLWVSVNWVGDPPNATPPPVQQHLTFLYRISIPDPPTSKFVNPVPMGVSIGNLPQGPSGTAGLLVTKTVSTSGPPYILSNNHVIGVAASGACPGTATPGTTLTGQPGSSFSTSANAIASFSEAANILTADAAISQVLPTWREAVSSSVYRIGTPSAQMGTAMPGEVVVKSGATTGVTAGTITAVNVTVHHSLGTTCVPPYVDLTDQIVIQASSPVFFDAGGDSGSAILDAATHQPIGLLWGGAAVKGFDISDKGVDNSSVSVVTIANSIQAVTSALKVTPVGLPSLTQASADQLNAEAQLAALKPVQARHEAEILALPGVQAIGITREGGKLMFVAFGPQRTPELARLLPREIEGVPLYFMELGGEIVLN